MTREAVELIDPAIGRALTEACRKLGVGPEELAVRVVADSVPDGTLCRGLHITRADQAVLEGHAGGPWHLRFQALVRPLSPAALRRACVHPGEVLAETIPDAAELHPARTDLYPVLRAGFRVRLSSDGRQLVAAADGVPEVSDGLLNLVPLQIVPGDVDRRTGHVDAPGHLLIGGSITRGFRAHAGGHVLVGRHIDRASVTGEGDLVVGLGIVGGTGTNVSVTGSVWARYLERAVLLGGGDVTVGNSIQNSDVTAGGVLRVLRPPGHVSGAQLKAGRAIEVLNVGLLRGEPTHLTVGEAGLHRRLTASEREMDRCREDVHRISAHLEPVLADGRARDELDESTRRAIHDCLEHKSKLLTLYRRLQQESCDLRERIARRSETHVDVRGLARAGTGVSICGQVLTLKTARQAVRFMLEAEEVVATPLEEAAVSSVKGPN